jgi:hypothetical protein
MGRLPPFLHLRNIFGRMDAPLNMQTLADLPIAGFRFNVGMSLGCTDLPPFFGLIGQLLENSDVSHDSMRNDNLAKLDSGFSTLMGSLYLNNSCHADKLSWHRYLLSVLHPCGIILP